MNEERNRKALTSLPTDYEVGYGKPPASTRFAPGRSGNPKGRPKGSKSRPKPPALNEERLKSILMQEAYRTIKVNEGAGQVTIPMAQAVSADPLKRLYVGWRKVETTRPRGYVSVNRQVVVRVFTGHLRSRTASGQVS